MKSTAVRLFAVWVVLVSVRCVGQSVLLAPSGTQSVAQPSAGLPADGTTLNANSFEQVRYADQFAWQQSPSGSVSAPGAATAITAATNNTSTGIVTLTFASNPFALNSWVIVSGVTPSSYNGTFRVLSSSGTQVTYQQYNLSLGAGSTFGKAVKNDQTITINAVRGITAFSAYPGTGCCNDYVVHSLYLAGKGTPEVVPITATTCTGANTGTCTITVTAANAHSAGYTIGSATAGWEEALVDCIYGGAVTNPVTGCKLAGSPYPSLGHSLMQGTFCVGGRQGSEGMMIIDGQGVTMEDAVVNGPMVQVNCEAPYYAPTSGSAGSVVVIENFAFAPHLGLGRAATGNQVFILDKGQNVTLRSNNFGGFINFSDVVDYGIRVSGDQQFALQDSRVGPPMKCDATFCGAAVYGDPTSSAAIGVLRNNNMSMNCLGNAIDWQSGNGLTIADNVFQTWSQFPWRYGGGLVDMTDGGGNYYEGGGCINPDFGVSGYDAGSGPQYTGNHNFVGAAQRTSSQPVQFNLATTAQLISSSVSGTTCTYVANARLGATIVVGNTISIINVTGGTNYNGNFPITSVASPNFTTTCSATGVGTGGSGSVSGGAGGNYYVYYIVGVKGGNQTRPLFIGYATSDGATHFNVLWHPFNADTYDTLRVGPLTLDGMDAAPFGTGNYKVQSGLVCASSPCTFTETFAAPASYTVNPRYIPLVSDIRYWPVPFFYNSSNGGGTDTPIYYTGPQTALVSTQILSGGNYYDAIFTSGFYFFPEAGGLTGARVQTWNSVSEEGVAPGAAILPPGVFGQATSLRKGRINMPFPSYSLTNSLLYQTYDSNPQKTLATAAHQPALDILDCGMGADVGKDYLAFQCGNPISFYVGHIMDSGTSRVAQFSSTGLSTSKQITSTIATGTAPLLVSSTTPVANLTAIPVTYSKAGAQQTAVHVVQDSVTLAAGVGTVTLSGSAAFSSSTSYTCAGVRSANTNAFKIVNNTNVSFTITSSNSADTDTVRFVCVGN